jgi:ATP-dependent DNA helicase RecG
MHNASDETIAQLIAAGESYRCEFKSDFSSKGDGKEKICRTICAFANDINAREEFGVIALGVNNDGTPSGLTIDDELEQKVLSIRGKGKIIPFPNFVTTRRMYLGQTILCIEVQPSISTPVKFDQRIWVRPGSRTDQANAEEERRLNEKRRNKDQPDDAQVLEGFRLHDLNLDYFKNQYLMQAFAPDVLQANGRTVEERLASTKMAGYGRDGALCPTVLGMLCLGLSPTDAVPGAYVQFVRFAGDDETSAVLDQQEIHGNIADVIQSTEAKFNAHNQIPINFTSQDLEQRFSQYPKVAFQQLFRNAVMHRSYFGSNAPTRVYWFNNRIRITNPGGPFGMGLEEFGQPYAVGYRNPNLAGALKDLGFVQRFGAGIGLARSELQKNGNPSLELDASANYVSATMHQRP